MRRISRAFARNLLPPLAALAVLALGAGPGPARAEILTSHYTYVGTAEAILAIQQFNPALGQLFDVTFNLSVNVTPILSIHNPFPNPMMASFQFQEVAFVRNASTDPLIHALTNGSLTVPPNSDSVFTGLPLSRTATGKFFDRGPLIGTGVTNVSVTYEVTQIVSMLRITDLRTAPISGTMDVFYVYAAAVSPEPSSLILLGLGLLGLLGYGWRRTSRPTPG